jgi:putative toxin-antitoxin system antitoxin component (TIGR02293 family)
MFIEMSERIFGPKSAQKRTADRLLGKAVAVFDDLDDAQAWLNSPQFGLGGAIPLNYATNEMQVREVENLLGRIAHGVYS